MTRTNALLALGCLLFGLGILLGALIPVSTSGTSGEKSCGAPWAGKDPIVFERGRGATDYAAECSDARQSRGTVAFVCLGLGVVAAGSAFVVDRTRSSA